MKRKDIIIIALTALLLFGAGLDQFTRTKPPRAPLYHQMVREASELAPMRIEDWVGEEIPVPPAAVQLLHPNVIVSRGFTNFVTASSVTFLLVQCSDARDLEGHYPPNCYPNQGWEIGSQQPVDWQVDDWLIRGTEYFFMLRTKKGDLSEYVDNFMVLPNGSFYRDITAIDDAEHDLMRRFYGAAQIQVVFDGRISAEDRSKILRTLVSGNRMLIEAILTGARSQ